MLAIYFPFWASRERERVVLVKLDENKNHPFFPTQVGRSFLSESVISILHSITLELIALFSLVETDFSVAKRFQKALPYMQCTLCAHVRPSSVFTCSLLLKRDIDFDESARQLNFPR